jgi:integrase
MREEMGLYKRGDVFWYKFKHQGILIRESAETENRQEAAKAERKRRAALDKGGRVKRYDGASMTFGNAAKEWQELKAPDWSPSNRRIEGFNFRHLDTHFKGKRLRDIQPDDINRYKAARINAGASPRTVGMEIGSLRALMRKHRLWADLQPDVKLPRGKEDIGRALSQDEEHRLLVACKANRSRSLYPAVLLALHTGLRSQELRHLRWRQVDFLNEQLTVGKSKTHGGAGRVIPLNRTAMQCLQEWRSLFPDAAPAHFVFPSERYGATSEGVTGLFANGTVPYAIDPTKPIGAWKTSWDAARKGAAVSCRFHDARHTFISRLAESQASDATIMAIAGHLSRKMLERYSHTRNEAKRKAVAVLDLHLDLSGSQKGGTIQPGRREGIQ